MSGRMLLLTRCTMALLIAMMTIVSQQRILLAVPPVHTTIIHQVAPTVPPSITAAQVITTTRGSGISLPGLADAKPTEDSEATTSESTNESATTAQTEGEPVASLSDVESAVIQIEAVGTFVDPAEGLQLNAAGLGSGFIIDPSGIAVTNNHVVTGGGLYKVYMAGEEEPRSAKVLGVSECADLAVIDIQGEGFPYLEWYDGAIKVGLDVYAAGFPLGDPEYTLTRGIVAKAKADGDSSWASVTKVIQHDAVINPGNSGGPLVDENGHVVAVNYAGNDETNQYFAISRDDAFEIVEQLRAGQNIDTIGINGEAVSDGADLNGIWVSSVKSGSPADRVGILPGDILVSMEGVSLGTDGTMATYCDVLRSHEPTDVLTVQVLRFDTQEMLEGQLNGRELALSFSFAEELAGQEAGTSGQSNNAETAAYSSYTTVSDRSGILSVEVPEEWTDVEDGDWVWQEETVGIRLVATPDIDTVFDSWGTPGVIFNVSTSLVADNTPEDLLEAIDYSEACTYEGREAVPEGFYTGSYDLWTGCDNGDSRAIVVSVVPETQNFIVLFEIFVASEADVEALDHILDSFVVNLESASTDNQGELNENIFDLVDVGGLTYDYVLVNEPALSAILPDGWSDIASDDWVDENEEVLGKTLSVAPDIQKFNDTWTMEGLYVRSATGLSEELDIKDLLDSVDLSDKCTYDDRYEHSHTIYGVTYSGDYDLYTNCEGEENVFAYLVAQSDDLSQAVFIEFLATTEADTEAFDVLLQSFYIDIAATEGEGSESSTGTEDTAYTLITDETGTLTVRVPAEWTDVSSGDWTLDEEVIGISLKAAIDLEEYDSSWSAPGLFFGASKDFAGADSAEVLDAMDYADNCKSSERFEYDDSVFAGHYDLWEGCGDTESLWVVLAALPKENADYLVLLNILLPTANDTTALEEILKSFNVSYSDTGAEEEVTLPIAEVTTNALNIRSGPGTTYARIGSVNQGDQLAVIGQTSDCGWLNIQTRDELVGWISGSSRYVTLNVACAAIPETEAPAPPQNSGSNQRPAPSAPQGNSNKGCYLFQNKLGAELNITFTRKGDGWTTTFKVKEDAELQQCFDPGDYTYTLDAPPPWGSTNGELAVSAGDNFTFPINPE